MITSFPRGVYPVLELRVYEVYLVNVLLDTLLAVGNLPKCSGSRAKSLLQQALVRLKSSDKH